MRYLIGFSAFVIPVGAWLLLSGHLGSEHPDFSRHEYLYINGSFQSLFRSFPEGSDRSNWTCYDGKTQRALSCTMVRGGWNEFQYIYRNRR